MRLSGLRDDLLPIVSDLSIPISPNSSLRLAEGRTNPNLGKVPSRLNFKGQTVGFPGWSNHKATDKDIEEWSANPTYGISIITRILRALDGDIHDPILAGNIMGFVFNYFTELGLPTPPIRWRANSSKFLLPFFVAGTMPKRSVPVGDKDIIEFLGTGQQFAAFGTHPSGARYEWVWTKGQPEYSFPELTPEQADDLWSQLVMFFGAGREMMMTRIAVERRIGETLDKEDPVFDYLENQGLIKGQMQGGIGVFIECPFDSEHSERSKGIGDTSTSYLIAGTNGHAEGHFKCLHAHCSGRKREEFLNKLDYYSSQFPAIEEPTDAKAPLPEFARDSRGRIMATVNNGLAAMRRPDLVGTHIAFDNFRAELMAALAYSDIDKGLLIPIKDLNWLPFKDEDRTLMRASMETHDFMVVSSDLARDCINQVGIENMFDSAIEWVNSLPPHDGVPRIDTFMSRYLGADETPYTRGVGRYLWTALVGRTLRPGVKADMVPIFEGAQGIRKSTAVEALVPNPDMFVEISLTDHDDNNARKLRGRLVAEISELRGIHTRDEDVIKAFITRTTEKWIPKFKEFGTSFARRCLFIGTTNRIDLFSDPTGNRRWLPVHVTRIDIEAIIADRNQLWAEAKVLFDKGGVDWSVELLSADVHMLYERTDSWDELVDEWLDRPFSFAADPAWEKLGDFIHAPLGADGTTRPRDFGFLPSRIILREALSMPDRLVSSKEEHRLLGVMSRLGFKAARRAEGGRKHRGFSPKGAPDDVAAAHPSGQESVPSNTENGTSDDWLNF